MTEPIEGTNVTAQQGATIMVGSPEATPAVDIVPNLSGLGGFVVAREGYKLHQLDPVEQGYAEHVFDDVPSFAAYMNRHWVDAAADNRVDILVQEHAVKAYIDPTKTEPQVIRCRFVKHPAWEAWEEALGSPLTQRAIQQFVRAWRVTIADSEALMAVFSAIQVTGASSMTSHIDETGAVRLASAEGKTDVAVKIPNTITATVPCYDGVLRDGAEATYQLEVLVSVETEPLMFRLRCPTIALAIREARRDVAAQLEGLLAADFLVGIGQGSHETRGVRALNPIG